MFPIFAQNYFYQRIQMIHMHRFLLLRVSMIAGVPQCIFDDVCIYVRGSKLSHGSEIFCTPHFIRQYGLINRALSVRLLWGNHTSCERLCLVVALLLVQCFYNLLLGCLVQTYIRLLSLLEMVTLGFFMQRLYITILTLIFMINPNILLGMKRIHEQIKIHGKEETQHQSNELVRLVEVDLFPKEIWEKIIAISHKNVWMYVSKYLSTIASLYNGIGLITHKPCHITQADQEHLMQYYCKQNDIAAVQTMLTQYPAVARMTTGLGCSLLSLQLSDEMTTLLIKHGVHAHHEKSRAANSNTLHHEAAYYGDIQELKKLLKARQPAQINKANGRQMFIKDNYFRLTPFHVAVIQEQDTCVNMLLEFSKNKIKTGEFKSEEMAQKFRTDWLRNVWYSLQYIAYSGKGVKYFESLVSALGDSWWDAHFQRGLLLSLASQYGHTYIVKYLLEEGIKPAIKATHRILYGTGIGVGMYPLDLAFENRHGEIFQLLKQIIIKMGLSIVVLKSSLFAAARHANNNEVYKMLEKRPVFISERDAYGNTLLHMVIPEGDEKLVTGLI